MLRSLFMAVLLAAWGLPALASPEDTQVLSSVDQAQLWINVGGFSYHLERDQRFNEKNAGFGLEWRTSDEVAYMAGLYRNSVGKNTQYVALNWQPWQIGPVRLGAAWGVMNGYPSISHGGSFFAALPIASMEGKRFGVNLGFIPKLGKVQSAVVLQFKWRLR